MGVFIFHHLARSSGAVHCRRFFHTIVFISAANENAVSSDSVTICDLVWRANAVTGCDNLLFHQGCPHELEPEVVLPQETLWFHLSVVVAPLALNSALQPLCNQVHIQPPVGLDVHLVVHPQHVDQSTCNQRNMYFPCPSNRRAVGYVL